MTRISALHLVFFLFLLALASCGKSKTNELEVTAGDTTASKCGAMKSFSVGFDPKGSNHTASSLVASMKASNGSTVSFSRTTSNGSVEFKGKVSTALKYQFKVSADTQLIYTSEVIDPKTEPTYQGCGVVRNCSFENGKFQCSTPL